MNSDDCIRKELYAECRIVGGTAVFVKGMYPAPHIHEHLATAY